MDISKICRKITDLQFGEVLWCHSCDHVLVNSNDPSSGTFYGIHGHVVNTESKSLRHDWPEVCFAICTQCEKEDS